MNDHFLKRDISDAIKGVALIMMFVHHFYTWPEWYVSGISYPELQSFARYLNYPLKACVPMFAFLTGYFYHFAGQKTLRYSLRKITDLLISHSAVCLALMIPALALGVFHPTPAAVATELIGMGTEVMRFSWYVSFYCLSMLLLPVLVKLSAGNPGGDLLIMLVLPAVAANTVIAAIQEHLPGNLTMLTGILSSVWEWFPVVISGYLSAKYRLFETYLDEVSARFSSGWGKVCFWLCLCAVGFAGRLALPRFALGSIQPSGRWVELELLMDVLYAPLFVYGLARLLQQMKYPRFLGVLGNLGRQSLYMWFFHAVFFNCLREYTQPLIYAPKNPVLVILLSLAVCYVLAVASEKMIDPLLKWKRKVL